jgi:hypothetical protein
VIGAVESQPDAGSSDGGLRSDVRAEDVVTSLIGIFLASGSTARGQRMLARRPGGEAMSASTGWNRRQ